MFGVQRGIMAPSPGRRQLAKPLGRRFAWLTPTPPGNLYKGESKGVAGKAIRKTMKTKGAQNAMVVRDAKSRANSEGLTCGNMGQGTTALYVTKGLSIEWRKSGLDGVY